MTDMYDGLTTDGRTKVQTHRPRTQNRRTSVLQNTEFNLFFRSSLKHFTLSFRIPLNHRKNRYHLFSSTQL